MVNINAKVLMRILIVLFCLGVFVSYVPYVNSADKYSPPFSFENRQVNRVLIGLYENDPSIWQNGQLYLIGLCYVFERQPEKAQTLFERLLKDDPEDARVLVAYGNVCHMMGNTNKAEVLYKRAWNSSQSVLALKQLAVLKLQEGDMVGLKGMLNDLLTHQKEEVEIQKVLLVYCLKIDDIKIAGPIVAKVVSALDRKTAENNADIRKVLLLVSDRYKSGENFELRPEIQHNGTTENHYKP